MRVHRGLGFVGLIMVMALLLVAGISGCSPCDILPPFPGTEPEIRFWATEQIMRSGGCTTLYWEVTDAGDYPIFFDGDEVAAMGQAEMCLEESTTFELVVGTPGGSIREIVTIAVESDGSETPPSGPTSTSPPSPPDATATQPPPPQPTSTSPPPPPDATATQPPPTATQPPPTATQPPPTATQRPPTPSPTQFVPVWGNCAWNGVEQAGIPSHQPNRWCSNGSFLVGLDLDRIATDAKDSPGVGQAQCCPLSAAQASTWGQCSWVRVHPAKNSHQPEVWCSSGQYLAGLDLDQEAAYDAMDSPVVGQGFCCELGDPYTAWGSCSWVKVHPTINSHQPVTWCPNGSFLAGMDLDREGSYDAMDSPVVGQAYCCTPK
jgi:hypothetical protein